MKLTLNSNQLLSLAQETVSHRISVVELVGMTVPPAIARDPDAVLDSTYQVSQKNFDVNARDIESFIHAHKNGGYLNRIGLIKAVRAMTGLGLRNAKVLVEVLVEGHSNHIHS